MRFVMLVVAVLAGGAAAPGGQAPQVVTQEGKKFQPSRLTIQRGDSVVFANHDPVVHNVFSQTPGFEFNLKRQPPGARGAVRFERVGVVDVRCAIHPSMKLTITVQ